MSKLKVLLINLPLPDYFHITQKGNTQIFSYYMKAISENENFEILHIPRNILESRNNKFLINEITKLKPEIVGFSSYLWNIDRNIFISKMLRESGIITITGGPEISDENRYILEDNFDYYFQGESESALKEFLSVFDRKSKKDTMIRIFNRVDFNNFISGYLKNSEDYKSDGLFYLEIERGCPYKCVYCAYNKFGSDIKEIRTDVFDESITHLFKTDEIKEVYLLAPTLNRDRKKFNGYLKKIIELKKVTGHDINFFGELRSELITDDEMMLLRDAGFREIEFGIQSLNKNAFKKLSREKIFFNFIEFSKKLLSIGINPMIDFIVGLPHDTYSNIIDTIEILDRNGLLQYSSFYHLHVLANTELRKIFNENKFIYDKRSPYFSYQVDTLTFNDIQNIYFYLEEKKGISDFTDFFDYTNENFYYIKNENDLINLKNTDFYHSASFLWFDNFEPNRIINFFNDFFRNNIEIFHKLFIYSEKPINFTFFKELNDVFAFYKNYYDLYKEGINFGLNSGFSKVFHVLMKPDVNQEYFNDVKNDYFTDFVILTDESILYEKYKDKIRNYYENDGCHLYLFNDLKGSVEDFIRVFPSKINS